MSRSVQGCSLAFAAGSEVIVMAESVALQEISTPMLSLYIAAGNVKLGTDTRAKPLSQVSQMKGFSRVS